MSFLEIAANISIIMIGVSLILIFIRLAIGPSIEDRIVAQLAFLGTVAFAYYLERRTRK